MNMRQTKSFRVVAVKLQQGYILPFVLVLLVALMVGSMSFFNRANDSTQLSGASRDYDQAMLLAESGANRVLGRFTNGSTLSYASIGCAAASMPGDLNCDNTLDNSQGRPSNFTPTLPLALGYEFYLKDASGSTTLSNNKAPGTVQMVANGEARNSTPVALGGVQTVLSTTTNLRVNDLFVSASIHPILLVQSATGLATSTNTWNAETAPEKVAVWLEVSRNPNPSYAGWFDLYLCSAAKVGNAKGYLQRYIGSYTDLLGNAVIAPISESANHG